MRDSAHGILTEARQTRQHYQVTGTDFDKIKANMYSIFECYAHGLITWDQVKTRFKTSIREYISLYKGTKYLKEEIKIMNQEYKNVLRNYKPALDAYRVVSEQKLTANLVAKKNLNESVAKQHSNTYYNNRVLSENDLTDTTRLTWKRVMEAYPNLTTKDEDRVRMLTIFEGPTLDTTQMITTVMKEEPTSISGPMQTSIRPKLRPGRYDDPDQWFNPSAGHRDQPSHPENRGLTDNPSSAPATSPRPRLRPSNLGQRAAIDRAVRTAMGEGWKELPPIDRDRYQERPGLEGPFSTLSGKVVYYDPKEGAYYDPDTDMYLSYDEFKELDNDRRGMKESARGLGSIDWPDVDEDGDSAMAQHAENAIRHGMHAYDAYGHVYSMTRERDWMEANKDMIIDMFAQYGLQTESTEKRWKQTSMSPEAAAKEFGKENVRVKKGALRNGDDMVEVFTEDMSDNEIDAFHRALDALVHKHLGHSSDEVDERKMTKAEKSKEKRLKKKYDDSDMKASMKKQYGDDWESVYFATIRKRAMNEWGGDDQYQAVEGFIENALSMFEEMLDNGEDELRARAEAHDYLKGELGDLGVRHGDYESKEYHGELEKEIIDIMNRRDKGIREGEEKPYICVHAKKGKYECHAGSSYEAAKKAAAHWKMKSTAGIDAHLAVEEAKRRPDHNMKARMRLQKIMQQAIKDSKKKRGIEDDDEKERTDEMTSAGGIATVAMPLGKMQRRKKTNESEMMTEAEFDEAAGEKDACYHKVKSRYKVWPSAYASGALVKCRKVGAKNWGNSKK